MNMTNPKDMANIDELYEKAGSGTKTENLGRYQKIIIFFMLIQIVMCKALVLGLPFYSKSPKEESWQCKLPM